MSPTRVDELETMRRRARAWAEEAGLDPWDVTFGLVDHDRLNELSAYSGFPERYPHWQFGMAYDYFRKRGAYSGWWTYELVLNTRPAVAYLRESNTALEHKAVMVHVYAHVDFFRHNRWFGPTDTDMIRTMGRHAEQIEAYMARHGVEAVESFIDQALCLQHNIDPHAPFIDRHWDPRRPPGSPPSAEEGSPAEADGDDEAPEDDVGRIPAKRGYMERYLNPPEWVEARRQRREAVRDARKLRAPSELATPQKDLLAFLERFGRLQDWQRDILAMIREESYYFLPQMQTKVMNEGWASYWQSRIMAERMGPDEVVDHAAMMSKVLGGGINPYSLGKRIWEDIRDRWDKGRFGREWEQCTDRRAQASWDTGAGLGLEKMFEVRRTHNDLTFISEFFTPELFAEMDLFTYEYIPETGAYHATSTDYEDVKRKLLLQHTNLGKPTVKVATGNHDNKGELLLVHEWNGIDLHWEDARAVLANVQAMWGRPVNLKTIVRRPVRTGESARSRRGRERPATSETEPQGLMLRYDGASFEERELDAAEVSDIRRDELAYRTLPSEWIR